MALKQWWDVPYTAADCMKGHTTFNNMIDYIKHSHCTDLTIYSTCTSGGQAFRFTQIGTNSQMYGGASTGDNLQILANDTDVYPYIKLLGDSDAEIWVEQDKFVRFYENGAVAFRFGKETQDSQIKGGATTTNDLSLWANETDAFPYIKIDGGGHIDLNYATSKQVFFYEGATRQRFKFYDTVLGGISTIEGGDTSGDDLQIIVNSVDNYPYIKLNALDDIKLYSDTDIYFYENVNERFRFCEHQIDFNADRAIYINDDETYVGHGAGDNIVAGTNNTLVGHDAGQANNFSSCVLFGYEAGKNNTLSETVAIGYQALLSNTGVHSTAVGFQALSAANNGNYNTALGYHALKNNTTGNYNTALGQKALFDNLGGHMNMAVGHEALENNTSGSGNIAIGLDSLETNTIGSHNVAIGTEAGRLATNNLNACIYIGYRTGKNNTASNRLYINNSDSAFPLIYGEFDNDVVKFGDNSAAWNIQFMQSRIHMLETTTPGAIVNYGALYFKADNKLYAQTGDGVEHEVAFV